MQLGDRIKELRIKLGLSGRQLAAKANVSPSFLSDIERNKNNPTFDTIQRICKALEITLSEFFSENTLKLSPEVRQVVDKVIKLPPDKIKVLNAVLDTWTESE